MSESYMEGVDPLSLQQFEEEGYSDEDALNLAQGLLDDAVPHLKRIYLTLGRNDKLIAKYAVLEMAQYLKNERDNFDRATSPFQSENLGSYSYSKMAQNIREKIDTGVPAFDRAVARFAEFAEEDEGAAFSSSSEQVFNPGYDGFIIDREGRNRGPFIPGVYMSSYYGGRWWK